MKIVPVIMAGGRGERFWPKSRIKFPKQFLNLLGQQSMLQLTVQRLTGLVPLENIHIVTGEEYRSLVNSQIPDLPSDNLIIEPIGRNTAPDCLYQLFVSLYSAQTVQGGCQYPVPIVHTLC
jgi:mannose-1-phosphate guanylyltransferase